MISVMRCPTAGLVDDARQCASAGGIQSRPVTNLAERRDQLSQSLAFYKGSLLPEAKLNSSFTRDAEPRKPSLNLEPYIQNNIIYQRMIASQQQRKASRADTVSTHEDESAARTEQQELVLAKSRRLRQNIPPQERRVSSAASVSEGQV